MRLKFIFFVFLPLLALMLWSSNLIQAAETIARQLAGRILLQVESRGEAWYINPANYKKYYLGRPDDAFLIMKNLGVGITNDDLKKIPLGLINDSSASNISSTCPLKTNDADGDCLPDNLEIALGTDPKNHDSDSDGYDDRTEILAGYDPTLNGKKLPISVDFTKKNIGKIFLQVQSQGEAWYINPKNLKRYYLGTPEDAWNIMKKLGLGIKNSLLNEIISDTLTVVNSNLLPPQNPPQIIPPIATSTVVTSAAAALAQAATAIRAGNTEAALTYFTPEIKNRVKYSLDSLNGEGRLTFANLLSGAKESGGSDAEKFFSVKTYFDLGGYEINLKFTLAKQASGGWLISGL